VQSASAAERDPLGDSCQTSGLLERVRLAVRVVPPSDGCNIGVFIGTTRLAVRVPYQAVWKWERLAPRKQRQAILLQPNCVVLALSCVVYKASTIS